MVSFVSATPSSSCCSPTPVWGLSRRIQSFTNFSTVGPFHGLQFFKNCSSTGPFHGMYSFRSYCSSTGTPMVKVPARKLAPTGAPHHGVQLLPGSCSCVGSPWAATSFTGTSTCSGVGSSTGCSVAICSSVVFQRLQRDNLHRHGLHDVLQWNLCSSMWTTSSPSFFTDLGVCRAASHAFFASHYL